MKTATIPHLNPSRVGISSEGTSTNPLMATEDELAQMSEATLDRLSKRVRRIVVDDDSIDAQDALFEGPLVEDAPTATFKHAVDEATQSVVDLILERSSPSAPVVLLFVGSEPNHHVDEMTARVAAALSDHGDSRVLLIDSDQVSRNLTAASRRQDDSGMTEIIEYNQDWRGNLLRNQRTNLDFIPVGNGSFGRWNQKELLRKAVCEMKTDYQFVCVSGGDAHSKAAKLWSDVCDGSYLLVSIKNSNGSVARSAVTELKSNGARLLGCVVTDVDKA